jgi:ribosomal protein S18 acetylase RimI-like enzyme
MNVDVRTATPDDAGAIATLHTRVWQATYRSLAPAAAIATLTAEVRLARWQTLLHAPPPGQVTLVAQVGGVLAGFGQLAPASNDVFGGRVEIRYLYVDVAHQARGIGRRLMAALARAAIDQDAGGVALGVVDGNDRAVAFYQHLGGRRIGRYTDAGPVWRSDNLVYAWDDLAALAGRTQARMRT